MTNETKRPTNADNLRVIARRTIEQYGITVGSRVSFIASGKGARMDGINGQRVTGTITRKFDADNMIVAVDQSSFGGTLVPFTKLRRA